MKSALIFIGVAVVLAVLAGWTAISAPFLGNWRAGLVQGWIDKAGGGVTITGPLNVDLGQEVHVTLENITVAGPVGVTVAKAEADMALSDLLHRKVDPSNILVTGATATLVRKADGTLEGAITPAADSAASPAAPPDPAALLAALDGKTIQLTDSRMTLQDQVSNFSFDAALATMTLQGDQGDGAATLKGSGTLNGQPLDLSVALPKDAPLTVSLTSGTTALAFKGADGSKGLDGILPGELTADSADLSQTLKVLQLNPVLMGHANSRAVLGQSAGGDLSLTEISVNAALDDGPSAQISGSIGNLRKLDDASIAISVSLFPLGKEPPKAVLVKDLRLTSVHMTLAGPLKGDTQRSMTIVTNGFTINTAGVGPAPVQLSQISRGASGELVVGSVAVQIGPVTAPWLTVNGKVGDLLTVSGLDLGGKVAFPMSNIIGADEKALPEALGNIAGQFKLSGKATALALSDLNLGTEGTDLWSLKLAGSIATLLPLSGIDLTIDASVQSAAMLKALGKDPIQLDPLHAHLAAKSTDSTGTVSAKASMQLAKSNVTVDLVANNRGVGPVIKGSVTSDLIRLEDLRDGILVANEIVSQFQGKPAAAPSTKRPVTRSNHGTQNDEVQGITIGLIDKDRLLKDGDVNISVNFAKVSGKASVKGIEANLLVSKGKASLGPLKFAYGGGQFDLLATVDAVNAPKVVRLKGSTSGWDFGEIVKAMKVKFPATGTVDASFDITGNHSSVADFISSLDGSTTVRMKNGTIDTQLLDLAGLGVVPWLFSKERGKYARITCLKAPLDLRNGVVSTREAVVETPEVQLVLYGSVNLPRKSIDISGQPRPIGKPLKRSPWPFTLAGPLSHPKVKVKDGPARVRRVDGADKMPAKRVPCVPDIMQLRK